MASIVPYLYFVGTSNAAVAFYKDTFGGEAEVQSDGDRVVHFEFRAGDIHFMGSDVEDPETASMARSGGDLVLNCDSEEQLRAFYATLAEGGTEVFAPVDGGWGALVAHCVDGFGVTWMLNFDVPEA
jgi:PhnB protein